MKHAGGISFLDMPPVYNLFIFLSKNFHSLHMVSSQPSPILYLHNKTFYFVKNFFIIRAGNCGSSYPASSLFQDFFPFYFFQAGFHFHFCRIVLNYCALSCNLIRKGRSVYFMRKLFSTKKSVISIVLFILLSSMFLLSSCGSTDTSSQTFDSSTTADASNTRPGKAVKELVIETEKPVEIQLMMIGDILVHQGVYKSGMRQDGTLNYDHLFQHILPDIEAADIRIVNQETILGGNELGFSGYPLFNSPQEIGDAEAKAGFNTILHATNHTLDQGQKGVENCKNFWKKYPEINVLGINETEEDSHDITIFKKEDFRVALLNYTYGTNGIPLPSSKPYIVNLLNEEKIIKDVTAAKELADMVVVCPHWGTENLHATDAEQARWTQLFADLNVDVVIGTHSHVMGEVEVLTRKDGNPMLVYYSLGNFVSTQSKKAQMIGGMANVTLVKDRNTCYIKDYAYTPVITQKASGPSQITTYKLTDYTEQLAVANRIRGNAGCGDFSLSYCNTLARQVLGEAYDENERRLYVKLQDQ